MKKLTIKQLEDEVIKAAISEVHSGAAFRGITIEEYIKDALSSPETWPKVRVAVSKYMARKLKIKL